jgi:hypothetical protein
VKLNWMLTELEKKAARCIAEEAPPADHVRDLARGVIELVRRLRAGEHPYRQAVPEPEEMASLVALERALDECHEKLAKAERELQEQRSKR